jgi:hypothetical protein
MKGVDGGGDTTPELGDAEELLSAVGSGDTLPDIRSSSYMAIGSGENENGVAVRTDVLLSSLYSEAASFVPSSSS